MHPTVKTAIIAYFTQNPTVTVTAHTIGLALKIPRPGIVLAQLRKAGFLKSAVKNGTDVLVWSRA